jgi:hypothetical protein
MTEPTRLELVAFRSRLRAFFKAHGRIPKDSRIRDSIREALGADMKSVGPEELAPVPYERVELQSDDERSDEHRLLVLDCFRRLQREQGQSEYVVWSDAFYDDPDHEEEKAYRCPIDYSIQQFVEKYDVTGLCGSSDTVLARPDFRQMLVVFHHGWYEFYDAAFAKAFLEYCRRQPSVG